MANRSTKTNGYIGLGNAARILDITTPQLNYLCKTNRVKFELTESGRKIFCEASLAILPKDFTKALKASKVPDGFISVKAAAKIIGLSTQSIYRYIKQGRLDAFKPKGTRSVYLDPEDLVIDGVNRINKAPTITAPQETTEDFMMFEAELVDIKKAFNMIQEFIGHCATNAECPKVDAIDYVKNSIMYQIQNLIIV